MTAPDKAFDPNSPRTVIGNSIRLLLDCYAEQDGQIDKDPHKFLDQFINLLEGTHALVDGKDPNTAFDWTEKIGCKPVTAESLRELVDVEIPYLINPLVARGFLTQIQGIQKGGKSAFSIYLAMCAATNTWPFPELVTTTSGPLKVLYIAWEDPEIMMAKRLSLYGVGLGFDRLFMPQNLSFLFGPTLFMERADHGAALEAAIQDLGADIVFVDTLSQIHACDENQASEMKIPMRRLMDVARNTQCGLVYLHHTLKSSGANGRITVDKGRGSGSIAAAWHILVDWGQRESKSNINPIEIQSKLEHEWKYWNVSYEADKNNHDNPKLVTGVRWGISRQESEAKDDVGSTPKKRKRILETLGALSAATPDGYVSALLVTDACNLGIDQRSVRDHLKHLCELGEVLSKTAKDGNTIVFRPSGL